MVNVILIRHGETDWNREQIFRGRIDVALNKVGLAQAGAVKESLKDVKINGIFSSPLSRAFQTARVLGESMGLDVEIEKGLIDIDFGQWQGLSHEQVKEKHKGLYETWLVEPHKAVFPDGESLEDVCKRSILALEKVIKKHPGETLAIVSHRVLNKVILCAILGLKLSRFWYIRQDTCAINRFEYKDGNYYLTLLNDTCHLKEVKGASVLDF